MSTRDDYELTSQATGSLVTARNRPVLELPGNAYQQAVADLRLGFKNWQLWRYLGWHDIRQRYRRSTLGPLWITVTMGVQIGSIALIFGLLFHTPLEVFLPYIAIGNIIWGLWSGLLNEGCTAFVASEGVIKQLRMPLSIAVYRMAWRNLIVFFHNIWIFVIVIAIFREWPHASAALAIPGLLVFLVSSLWMSLILAVISTRFRDVPLIVNSVLQLLYLATPLIWQTSSLNGKHAELYQLNPIYHMVEVVRAPLMGGTPTLLNWEVSTAIAVIGWMVTLAVFVRLRRRIAFWL